MKSVSFIVPTETATCRIDYIQNISLAEIVPVRYSYQNPFGLMKDNLSQRNYQNQLIHPALSHTEQECQESLSQEKIHNQQNLNEGLKYS